MIKLLAITAALLSCGEPTMKNAEIAMSKDTGLDRTNFNPPIIVKAKSIYDFKVEALDGSTIDFASFKGKKILVVNTASQCGYTPQYEGLEALYKKYQDKLVIVGFPANNFGGQEPGTNTEIKEFCKKNYGVTFPMAAKVSVKGDDVAPIYKWLCSKSENGVLDAEIGWNFGKFLLDEKGNLINYFPSKVTPMSEELTGKL
jgi:glutathione peroxidase